MTVFRAIVIGVSGNTSELCESFLAHRGIGYGTDQPSVRIRRNLRYRLGESL